MRFYPLPLVYGLYVHEKAENGGPPLSLHAKVEHISYATSTCGLPVYMHLPWAHAFIYQVRPPLIKPPHYSSYVK